MRILSEASGSLTSSYLINAIQKSGYSAIASDIDSNCYAKYLADDFVLMPKSDDPNLWDEMKNIIRRHKIDVILPSLDETLLGWAKRKKEYNSNDILVVLSDEETIKIFQDKWLTYNFFTQHDIPTPSTSLKQEHPLIKPRFGRGSVGVYKTSKLVNMDGNVSQQFVEGIEYTIDVFCDSNGKPVYIVPRERINVREGKSTAGIVVKHNKIEHYVQKICRLTNFVGPINMQCIETSAGEVQFIEVNPRIAGGMALGFAATENWIDLIVNHFVFGKEIHPVEVQYGLKMMRYYNEVFTFE